MIKRVFLLNATFAPSHARHALLHHWWSALLKAEVLMLVDRCYECDTSSTVGKRLPRLTGFQKKWCLGMKMVVVVLLLLNWNQWALENEKKWKDFRRVFFFFFGFDLFVFWHQYQCYAVTAEVLFCLCKGVLALHSWEISCQSIGGSRFLLLAPVFCCFSVNGSIASLNIIVFCYIRHCTWMKPH